MSLPPEEGWNIPFDSPFYPPLPASYRDVQFQFVFFRADPAGVARLLPEPLQSTDGQCVAIGIRVPFCTAYGAFDEAVVVEHCTFDGQEGWYVSHVWHDGPAGIAAGREIYGTPKIFSDIEVKMAERTMLTRARMGDLPVIAVSSTMTGACEVDDLPDLSPSWRLKIIPRADGPGPAIKQLIDGSAAMQDLEVHVCRRGKGTVEFGVSPLCDVTCLKPLAFGEAFYMESSYSEGFATIAHDYLAGE